jgi:shikimate kinase
MMRRGLNNLFLVGPMGAGKSTIGKQLAKELKLEFYDVDQVIEARTGADIGWIFDVEGESGFRIREAAIIDELSEQQGIVLATGGGAIVNSMSRTRLAARGVVVYLYATVAQQMQRTAKDKRRPLLQNKAERLATLEALMEERDILYREIADITVATDSQTVKGVAASVIRMLDAE